MDDPFSTETLEVADSTNFAVDCINSSAFFTSPETITVLSVVEPPVLPSSTLEFSNDSTLANVIRPLSADQLKELLQRLPHLETVKWISSLPPPDGVCELLASLCPRLSEFVCEPQNHQLSSIRVSLPKWTAPSLSLLSNVCLTSLRLSRLSQEGARSFALLLHNLGEDSPLEQLAVDFVWFDDSLCERIAEAGKRLRKLSIGTSGTRFSDKGLVALLEGCGALQQFTLDEVQGRLSRSAWSKPDLSSSPLKDLTILVSEPGMHHSWCVDHLASIHAVPMDHLESLVIRRKEGCPTLENGCPVYPASTDDVVALRPAPDDFIDSVSTALDLKNFECDLWSLSLAGLKRIIAKCTKLETVRICLDAPFSKLLTCSSFSSLPNLHALFVSISPENAPGRAPIPVLPRIATSSLPTPADSPVIPEKSIPPVLQERLSFPAISVDTDDPSAPNVRDVKKFVRKCPKIELIEWYGKYGRGSWIVQRSTASASSKTNTTTISVDHRAPVLSEEVYHTIQLEQQLHDLASRGVSLNDFPRDGQEWTGYQADLLATERNNLASDVHEQSAPSSPTKTRKHSFPSLHSQSSEGKVIPVPLLTPPLSDSFSLSESPTNTAPAWGWSESTGDNGSEGKQQHHQRQRRPSEPASGRASKQASKARARSATVESKMGNDKNSNGNGHGTRANGKGRGSPAVHRKSSSSVGVNLDTRVKTRTQKV